MIPLKHGMICKYTYTNIYIYHRMQYEMTGLSRGRKFSAKQRWALLKS